MSAQQATAEKSMEEILASIRRTIENDVHKNQQGGHMSEQGTTQTNDEDVFELTQVVNEDGSVSEVATSETTSAPQESIDETNTTATHYDESDQTSETVEGTVSENNLEARTQTSEEALDQLDQASATVQTPQEEPAHDTSPTEELTSQAEESPEASSLSQETEELISETVAQVAGQALSDLSKAVETSSQTRTSDTSALSDFSSKDLGQSTVEGLMRELLRPMLKDWLDAHLPSLVKWIVTEQIEKIIQEKKKN